MDGLNFLDTVFEVQILLKVQLFFLHLLFCFWYHVQEIIA